LRCILEGISCGRKTGSRFFWLGDTAWELIHRGNREETSYYLKTRAEQGFTVIQTVVLAEFDGISTPTELGERPFLDGDPTKPNEKYFNRVVEVVDEAARHGLYVALLPAWGDKLTAPWGVGPRLFRNDNLSVALMYGAYLGRRLKDRTNVVWILGGDRPPRMGGSHSEGLRKRALELGFAADQDWTPIWREMARGILEGSGAAPVSRGEDVWETADRAPVILYHPNGGVDSTSVFLHGERWLSVNGMQSGHGAHDTPVWEWIARDWALTPAKPTLDLEPNYEDHPFSPWPSWDPATGYFRDVDVRRQVYRSVFAGGCGVTYGHHAVWQMAGKRYEVINHADRDWMNAMQRPAGRQMRYLRALMESRPYFMREPDPSMVEAVAGVAGSGEGALHVVATRDANGSYAFVYFPATELTVKIHLRKLRGKSLRAWWYDPRTGMGMAAGRAEGESEREWKSPAYGPDWVLVVEDTGAGFAPPGLGKWEN
jgi:hypothetical protein